MNVFILYAHPENKQSFNGALLERSINVLEDQGHQVKVSDLYAMNFNPVANEVDFTSRRFPEHLQYDREQKHAAKHQAFSTDIQEEIDKVFWCDVLIVQFPMYWFSMPAIMKGWFDRVFVNSIVYGAGKRFETGGLRGRKAMVCMSTGAMSQMFESDGLLGDIDVTLWPIHNGIFRYVGLEVLPEFVSWSPAYADQQTCDDYLNQYEQRLRTIEDTETLAWHPLSDFDDNFKLKNNISPRTIAHKRK